MSLLEQFQEMKEEADFIARMKELREQAWGEIIHGRRSLPFLLSASDFIMLVDLAARWPDMIDREVRARGGVPPVSSLV